VRITLLGETVEQGQTGSRLELHMVVVAVVVHNRLVMPLL
jgi:hypothetical protein